MAEDRPRRRRRLAAQGGETVPDADAARKERRRQRLQERDAAPAEKTDTRGFVFAATGDLYTVLARRAARTLRNVMPDAAIDLFTDQTVVDDVFAQIHGLADGFRRPKMEAMRRSRFDRTVMLDADVIVLVPVPELFDILDGCEIAGAPGVYRNAGMGYRGGTVPRSFPVVNSGVLAFRRSPRLEALLTEWEAEVRQRGGRDQPSLRRLLYRGDLKFSPLGYEYNFMHLQFLDSWRPEMGAPRILHVAGLHKGDLGRPDEPFDLREVMGRKARLVEWLLAADWSLGGNRELRKPGMAGLLQHLLRRKSRGAGHDEDD